MKALGLGLAAPVALQLARAAVAAASPRPKRFMLFYLPHGVPPEHFDPVVTPGNAADFTFTASGESILGPLEPYKAYVNVIRGFKYPGAMTHEAIISCLSNVSTFAGEGGPVDETTPRTTVEHMIANGLGVRPLILGACAHRPFGLDKDGKLMWDGQPVAPEKNPLKAYDDVFGNLGAPEGPDPNVALREALVTLTEGELNALDAELAGLTSEQTKLRTHLEGVQALKGEGSVAVSCTSAPTIPAIEALRPLAQGQSDDFFLAEGNFPSLLAAQLELAAHALVCNAAPVVAVQPMYANCEFDFTFVRPAGDTRQFGPHHTALSHTQPQQNGAEMVMETRSPFAIAQRWFVQNLVDHMVAFLDVDDPADPGRTVLDNTIVYFMSEVGEGAWHTTESRVIQVGPEPGPTAYLPLITIGGGGGALKTQQVLTAEPDRSAGDIYLALTQAMGVPAGSFGEANTPFTEILA